MLKFMVFVCLLTTSAFCNSLSQIQESKTIRIGVWKDQAPFSSLNGDKFEGFEVDMAKKIADTIAPDAKLYLVGIDNTDQRISFLQENKVDIVIASFTKTAQREKLVDFAMPYFSVAQGALVQKGVSLKSPSDLRGKTVIIQKNSTASEYMKTREGSNLVFVDSTGEGYRLLSEKKGDVYLNDNLIVMAYPIINSEVEVPATMRNIGASDYLAPAVQKGNTELKNQLDNAMIKLSKERFFKNIYNDTFGPFYRNMADPKYFLLEDLYRIYG